MLIWFNMSWNGSFFLKKVECINAKVDRLKSSKTTAAAGRHFVKNVFEQTKRHYQK